MSDAWKPPVVSPFETVEYKLNRTDKAWSYMMVVKQSVDCLTGLPIDKFGYKAAVHSDGVIHEDDPRLQDKEWCDRFFAVDNDPEFKGVWRLGPQRKRLDSLEKRVAVLEALLGEKSEGDEPAKRRGRPPKNQPDLEPVSA